MSTRACSNGVNRSHGGRAISFASGIAAITAGWLALAGCPGTDGVQELFDAAATAFSEARDGTTGADDSSVQPGHADSGDAAPQGDAAGLPGSASGDPNADSLEAADGVGGSSGGGSATEDQFGHTNAGSPPDETVPPTDSSEPPPALAGSCAQGILYGDINGAEATATVEVSTLTQVMGEAAGTIYSGTTYVVFAGEIHSGPYGYVFSADIYGASGFGDMVSYADGSRFRIRVDLYPDGFLLATGVFESDCGAAGCGQYVFACR